MKIIKKISKKVKIALIVIITFFSSILLISFEDDYFEISKNLDLFATLFREINTYYVDDTDPGELMKTAIDAMLSSLDPYTNYIPESDIEDFRFATTGQYGGIGAIIRKRGEYVIIVEPYEGYPAQLAGLKAGDKIIEVNGKSAKGKSSEELSKILKGQAKTTVTLKVEREGEKKPLTFTIIREKILIKNVPYFGVVKDNIGYIKLESFREDAAKEVENAVKKLKEQNVNGIVLDLRNNGGGLLKEAVDIVNIFIPKGELIVNTKGKLQDWNHEYKSNNVPVDTKIPLAVLVNKNSASASEIVAGALQDLDRAVIIGQNTFGKGLVQQTRDLSYNAKIKLTVAKYYIPSGRCIQKINYAHKDKKGNPEFIPDSLKKTFYTKNGRKVLDGDGIEPDIKTSEKKFHNISSILLNKMYIFDFATLFALKHSNLPPPDKFSLDEKTYNEFIDFLSDKDYEYTTKSEELLAEFKKTAEEDKYFDAVETEYEALSKKFHHSKKNDLFKFKKEIMQILENEIVSRYYYKKGRIINSFKYDKELEKANEILNDTLTYNNILAGKFHYPEPESKTQEKKSEIQDNTEKDKN